jgi:hypothetical protein
MYTTFSFSGGIEKGFDALKIYNYFEAKAQFEKNLKKDSVACAYGLSVIHFRKDNPFHNTSQALINFEIVLRNLSTYSDKQKAKILALGIDSSSLDTLKSLISQYYFEDAKKKQSYLDYLIRFKWAQEYDSAVYLLDRMRYDRALEDNDREAYQKFIGFYPESNFKSQAEKRYNKSAFEEITTPSTALSYSRFVDNFPDNPYVSEAEDEIYRLTTKDNSLRSFKFFIESFPNNKNVFDAWKRLYHEYMIDLSEERYLAFKEEYPDYPFMGDLEVEFKLSKIEYLPFTKYEKWGFVDTVGFVRIQADYESVEKFKEGLAIVSKNDLYGAINKKGDLVIAIKYDELYDFNEGVAIVGANEKYGLVNISGEEILKIEYDDVSEMKEGLAKAEKEGLFGFYDKNGFEKIEAIYDDVSDFDGDLVIVSKEGKYGIIDRFGVVVMDFQFNNLIIYNEVLYAAESEDGWGIITIKQDTILDFEMDLIEPVHQELAYFEYDGEFGFLNDNGRIAIEADYTVFADDKNLCYFKNEHALIRSGDKYGLINQKGKKVIPTIFSGIGYFDNLIPISKGGQWGYCDGKANRKIDYQYDYASNFTGNFAIVEVDGNVGLIDNKGEFVLPTEYQEISFLGDSFIKVKKKDKFGLYNLEMELIIPVENDELKIYSDVLISTTIAGELNYFNLKANAYIEME